MERAELDQIERVINHELRERFLPGAVERAVLLQHGDDPAIQPGQLLVRVFVPPPDRPEDYERALAAWQGAHQAGMDRLRRELSLRLPAARLLEFTFEDPGAAANQTPVPRIAMPDDGSLAAEQMSGREIVTTALSLLRANYVFPELAEQAATAVEAQAGGRRVRRPGRDHAHRTPHQPPAGSLRGQAPGGAARRRAATWSSPARPGTRTPEPRDHEARRQAMRQRGRLDNFGIHRVERLDGNVGYLDVRRVAMPANAGPAIAAAMELVAGTYALIIDLRHNHGGSPEGVVFWCSYLFDERPVHFNDIFHADTGETRQFWALPYVPGSRYIDRPVYVLTSSHTFSGGEDFCYTLQALGRAEVIGETTGGGAHPTRPFPISAAVHIAIPFARSVNPVTGTNWQGTGVVPDFAVPEAQAYDVAYAKALTHVLAKDDVPPPITDEAREALAALPVSAPAVAGTAVTK